VTEPHPAPGRALRVGSLTVYALLATGGMGALAPGVASAWRALVRPYAFEPTLSHPWVWLSLCAVLLGLVWTLGRRQREGRRAGLKLYAGQLAAVAATLLLRRLDTPPVRASSDEALRHAVARAVAALQERYGSDGRYPADASLPGFALPEVARFTGLYRRGLRPLETRVVVRTSGSEPLLVDDGQGPASVVVVLDDARQRFWVTAWGLDPAGRVAPLLDGGGRVLTAAGASGRPLSNVFQGFPDYPRKAPALPLGGAVR